MTLYMYQASYTAKSMAAQLTEPHDPMEAIAPTLEELGAKVLVAGFPFGEYDVLVVYEAADDVTAASVAMAVAAAGEVKSANHTAAQRAGMARVVAQAQDRHHPEGAPAVRPSERIAGNLIERRQIRGCHQVSIPAHRRGSGAGDKRWAGRTPASIVVCLRSRI